MAPLLINWITSILAANVTYIHSSDNIIHIVEYMNTGKITTDIASAEIQKLTVYQLGLNVNALVAINGGYHGYDTPNYPGSITKLKIDGKMITSFNNATLLKENGLSLEDVDSILAINNKKVSIKSKINDTNTTTFLYSGPMLLKQGRYTNVSSHWDSVHNPRTVVCTTKNSTMFIVIGGRLSTFAGMTLMETQAFLLHVGCINAINLDGGGSTTMYIQGLGVVNTPRSADGKGGYITTERHVSNIIYIK